MEKKFKALSKQDVKDVINGKRNASRVPVLLHFWTTPSVFEEKEPQVREICDAYEQDAQVIPIETPAVFADKNSESSYSWLYYDENALPKEARSQALDKQINIPEFEDIDQIIEHFPSPYDKAAFSKNIPVPDGRYRLFSWWYCFFERHWSLRGMENALTDFYLYPDEVHKLYRALTDFYKGYIERAAKNGADGIFTSDDIGTQTGPFFSVEIFREFFKPYYKELIECAHSHNMHFWLHTCGNILDFMDDFAEIGLDVIHPIQKYTMDEKEAAKKIDGRICIWAGFDVQQTIPYKTADDVKKEVRFMMDTYFRDNGKFMITAGNGITPDCPIDSLNALYSECYEYGAQKCSEDK